MWFGVESWMSHPESKPQRQGCNKKRKFLNINLAISPPNSKLLKKEV